jgi:hypothetical protein
MTSPGFIVFNAFNAFGISGLRRNIAVSLCRQDENCDFKSGEVLWIRKITIDRNQHIVGARCCSEKISIF